MTAIARELDYPDRLATEKLSELVQEVDSVEELLAALAPGQPGASEATLAAVRSLLEDEDFTQQATLVEARDALALIRDRIGSKGAGIPEEGSTNFLLRQVVDQLSALNIEAQAINIDGDVVGLNTDQLEALTADLGAALGTTSDPSSLTTAIGILKRIVEILSTSLSVTGPLTDEQLRATAMAVTGPLTDGQLRASPVAVASGFSSLTERMLAKAPAAGKNLWLDPAASTNLGTGVVIAQADEAAGASTAAFDGVFIPAVGQVVERSGFAWDDRLTGW